MLPKLGLKDEDWNTLTQEVTVVFFSFHFFYFLPFFSFPVFSFSFFSFLFFSLIFLYFPFFCFLFLCFPFLSFLCLSVLLVVNSLPGSHFPNYMTAHAMCGGNCPSMSKWKVFKPYLRYTYILIYENKYIYCDLNKIIRWDDCYVAQLAENNIS